MTQFSSVDPQHFEGKIDYGTCRVNGDECYGCVYCPPEREAPFEGTNRANPILVEFRNEVDALGVMYPKDWLRVCNTAFWPYGPERDQYIEHARKVLTRLEGVHYAT